VSIGAAALHFVLRNPAVTTMLVGPSTIDELERNLDALDEPVPDALWRDLRSEGFIASAATELADAD
jgi:D-threo-aldose 1-dehydrogenase